MVAKRRGRPKQSGEVREQIPFDVFFAVWAQKQGWEVPVFHWEIMEFLSDNENWENDTGVIQVFRGASKSTILALFIVWMLVNDPTLIFIVGSADDRTAVRVSRDCRNVIERHPMAKHLYYGNQKWMEHEFRVNGSVDARNSSVSAYGVMSNVTGARCHWYIGDDLESQKNVETEDMRQKLRNRMDDATHLLIPGGKRLFIGTPHSANDIYSEIINAGASSFKLPLIPNPVGEYPFITGETVWNDRFDETVVKQRQMASTKGRFLSQYQLIPMSIEDSILDHTKLQRYNEEIKFWSANGETVATIGEKRMVSLSVFWDVSLSKAKGDASVLAVVFTSDEGEIFVHRTYRLTGDVDEQCEQIKEYAQDLRLPMISIEVNGVGGFVPQILIKHLRGLNIGVDEVFNTVRKEVRIIEALETPLSGGFIYAHETVFDSPFSQQIRDFSPRAVRTNQMNDDYIDSVSSCIRAEPIRIGRGVRVHNSEFMPWRSGDVTNQGEVTVNYSSL